MNQSAEAVMERLKAHNIGYESKEQPDGSYLVAVEMAGKTGKLYNVIMVFSANAKQVGIRVFNLAHVPTERQRPMLRVLNGINETYGWLRFYLDDESDVDAGMEAVIMPSVAANICWELLQHAFSLLDEVQESINKVLA